jgi:hypothetical protein
MPSIANKFNELQVRFNMKLGTEEASAYNLELQGREQRLRTADICLSQKTQ